MPMNTAELLRLIDSSGTFYVGITDHSRNYMHRGKYFIADIYRGLHPEPCGDEYYFASLYPAIIGADNPRLIIRPAAIKVWGKQDVPEILREHIVIPDPNLPLDANYYERLTGRMQFLNGKDFGPYYDNGLMNGVEKGELMVDSGDIPERINVTDRWLGEGDVLALMPPF